jgi:putative DNA primase/helicase
MNWNDKGWGWAARQHHEERRQRELIAGNNSGRASFAPAAMKPAGGWLKPDMRLVEDDRVPAPTLDNDALPAGWENWVSAQADALACSRDYIAAGLIGAASALIGNARRITATADWIEPPHLWFALIGTPSAGKTPALRPMIEASRVIEREAEPAWREALAQHERDAEAARATDEAWREKVNSAARDGSTVPDRPADAEQPTPPARPRVAVMDTSTEELQRLLAQHHRGLLYFRDELAGWLGNMDRYGGKGGDRGFYLECWNGTAYDCDRVKFNGVPIRIEHAALAMLGGMVPDKLREALAEADDGLGVRFIYIWPEPLPIKPLKNCSQADAAARREKLLTAARRLRSLPMGADEHSAPAPRALRLGSDAFQLFDILRIDAMTKARTHGSFAAEWHGKNPGRLLRLALVFELLAWAARGGDEPASVSPDAVHRAGKYLDYAGAMLDRVTAGLAIGRAEADAAAIGRHILAAGAKWLNERELYQTAGFSWARDAERRKAALRMLEQACWIRRPGPANHGRPRGDWEVSPLLMPVQNVQNVQKRLRDESFEHSEQFEQTTAYDEDDF